MIQRCKCMHVINELVPDTNMSAEVHGLYRHMLSRQIWNQTAGWENSQRECGCNMITMWIDKYGNARTHEGINFMLIVNHRYLKYINNKMRKIQY